MSAHRIQMMKDAVLRAPDDPRARYFLAHELFRAREWAEAARQYGEYLRLNPDDEGVGYKNYGWCLERLGRADEAAAAYREGARRAAERRHQGLAEEILEMLAQLEG